MKAWRATRVRSRTCPRARGIRGCPDPRVHPPSLRAWRRGGSRALTARHRTARKSRYPRAWTTAAHCRKVACERRSRAMTTLARDRARRRRTAAGWRRSAPAQAADMAKTLRVAFPVAENGFDPQAASDAYSYAICGAIFDPLYSYDYFARPVRMVPNTAEALPQITDGTHVHDQGQAGHLLRRRPGFQGQEARADRRRLRLQHEAHLRPQGALVLALRVRGQPGRPRRGAGPRAQGGSLDYDAKIEGLQALDRYTLRIRFRRPDYSFRWWLTTPQLAAVAREVVDAYKDASNRVMEHPVGTGAYA